MLIRLMLLVALLATGCAGKGQSHVEVMAHIRAISVPVVEAAFSACVYNAGRMIETAESAAEVRRLGAEYKDECMAETRERWNIFATGYNAALAVTRSFNEGIATAEEVLAAAKHAERAAVQFTEFAVRIGAVILQGDPVLDGRTPLKLEEDQ